MRAYNLSMLWIFICCGFGIIDTFDIFGSDFSKETGIFNSLKSLSTPIFTVPGIDLDVTGISALAGAMALATIVILNTNIVTDRGIALAVFSLIFWGSFTTALVVMTKIDIPNMEFMYTIFLLASTLIFINALVQMPTGGQRSHV